MTAVDQQALARWRRLQVGDFTSMAALLSLLTTYVWKARTGIAPNGWHADDAWVIVAATQAESPTELLNFGFTHPGFNVLLRLLARGPQDQVAFQLIPILAAVAALVVLFAMIKREVTNPVLAWIAVLPFAGSFLLFRYSLAIKPYTLEVLAFAVALYGLQRARTITNGQLTAWALVAVPITTLSFRIAFVSAVAAFGMYWGKKMSLRQLVALGIAHIATLAPLLLFVRSRFDPDVLTEWWTKRPGVFLPDDQSPIVSLWQQFHRVTRVIFDGPGIVGWLLVVLIIVGALDGVAQRRSAQTAAAGGLVLAMVLSALSLSPFGPQQLGHQRIDLWLAPALLLLTVSGIRFIVAAIGPHMPSTSRLLVPAQPALAAATALMLLAPVITHVGVDSHRYPDQDVEANLAYALFQMESSDAAVMVGNLGVDLQLAAHNPETVVDVRHYPSNMQGLEVDLSPEFFRTNYFVTTPELMESTQRVVGIRLQGQARNQFRSYLRDLGFVRTSNAQFPLVEVWNQSQ